MATDVFYSINPYGTGDLKTGSPTLTMSGGVATLTVAQTGNIGVGCRVTYDASSIAYIASVNSATSFNLITATGGTPSDEGSAVTVNSIAHEWASLAAAWASAADVNHLNGADLTALDIALHLAHYYDQDDQTPDTSNVGLNGATTDATRYVRVFTPGGGTESINDQRHSGIYDTNKSLIAGPNSSGGIIRFGDNYIRLNGLQVRNTTDANANAHGIAFDFGGATNGLIDKCIVAGSTAGTGIHLVDSAATATIKNTVVFQIGTAAATCEGIYAENCTSLDIYNCSVFGFDDGIERDAGTVTVTNTVSFGNTDDFDGTMTISNCASDDGDGSNPQTLDSDSNYVNEFTDVTTFDFSIVAGGVCEDNGTDLSGSGVTDDIIGTSRPQNSVYDIGAFELVSAGTDVDCTLGTMSIAGQNPAVSIGQTLFSGAGTLSISGLNPEVSLAVNVNCNLSTLSIAGQDPSVSAGNTLFPGVGNLNIGGLNPNVSVGTTIASTLGTLSIAGANPAVLIGQTLLPNSGTIEVSGVSPNISVGTNINSTLGTIEIAGINPTVDLGALVDCTFGTIEIAGINPSVTTEATIDCTLGALNVAGINPSVSVGQTLLLGVGSLEIAGINPTVSEGSTIDCSTGAIEITGANPSVEITIDIDCTSGSLEIVGTNPSVVATVIIEPATGTVIISGLNPDIEIGEFPDIPLRRVYAIEFDNRVFSVDNENRTYSIL